jgi:ribosomal protein L11 methyltransferase
MQWIEFRANVLPAEVDRVEEILLEESLGEWQLHEDVTAGCATIGGLFISEEAASSAWSILVAHLAAGGLARLSQSEPGRQWQSEADLRESYRKHFAPWHYGPLQWIPVWMRESHVPEPGKRILWLDPGMAFGTGNHETTRLVAERLVDLAEGWRDSGRGPAGRSLLDVGCGSGILALSAALLGYGPVTGLDSDPDAIAVSEANARLNRLQPSARFRVGNLNEGLETRVADIVLANIHADVLSANARALVEAVAPGGVLILSGILSEELSQVRAAFEGLVQSGSIQSRALGIWSDLLLEIPK